MTFPFSPATTLVEVLDELDRVRPGLLGDGDGDGGGVGAGRRGRGAPRPAPASIQTYCDGSSAPSETVATSRRKTGLPFQTATTAPPTSSALRKREPTSTWVSASAVAKLPAGRRQFAPESAM